MASLVLLGWGGIALYEAMFPPPRPPPLPALGVAPIALPGAPFDLVALVRQAEDDLRIKKAQQEAVADDRELRGMADRSNLPTTATATAADAGDRRRRPEDPGRRRPPPTTVLQPTSPAMVMTTPDLPLPVPMQVVTQLGAIPNSASLYLGSRLLGVGFTRTPLPPGRHVIRCVPLPNCAGCRDGELVITVPAEVPEAGFFRPKLDKCKVIGFVEK